MRLHDLVDQIDLPPTHVTDGAWDAASRRVRRRRAAVVATTAAAVAVVLIATLATTRGDDAGRPPANTPTPPTPSTSQPPTERAVDGPQARPQAVAVDPDDPDRRAVRWWSCDACGSLKSALALTEDGFETRTVLSLDANVGLAWAGDEQVALVDWEAGTAELVAFDGSRRPLRLGSESPVPTDSSIITATIDDIWQPVWIDVASATAHPVPRPAEAAGASDDSLWRDANGLVWFGNFEDHNTIATSNDGGATWTSHSFGSGYFVPAYSGANDVLAVLEYEDVNRQRLRLLWVWYSIDGGATWARTEEGSGPAGPIEDRGGVVRADGRLVMHGPDDAGLLVMDERWTYFGPAAWTPGGGRFDLLNAYGWGDSLTVIGRPADSADVYISATPGDDWTPFTVR
jgi:hypothetical protein